MPKQETKLTVFVASPSDVSDERNELKLAIDKANQILRICTNVRLDLIGWESVYPAMGEDPQEVINNQIPDDYDIFVGILWNRIGSPTNRAESGTIEEFRKAKSRHDKNSNCIQIMFYFKTAAPHSMKDFDPDQYKKVKEFQSEIEKEALYKEFIETEDFVNRIVPDLIGVAMNWPQLKNNTSELQRQGDSSLNSQQLLNTDKESDTDDMGYFDLEEDIEDELYRLVEVLTRMNNYTHEMGDEIRNRTKEIHDLKISEISGQNTSKNKLQEARAKVKRVLKKSSLNLDDYTNKMNQDIPLYRQHTNKSMNLLSKAVPIHFELSEFEDNQDLKSEIESMLDATNQVIDSMRNFKITITELPKLTTRLNRSKRATERVLEEVIDIARGSTDSLNAILSIFPETPSGCS